jgi:precorrin-6B methylase 2
MRAQKTRLWLGLSVALLVVATVGLSEATAQSLADVARETKKKKEQSTRTVLTNEDLGRRGSFPEIRLLGAPRQHPPSLAPYQGSPLEAVRQILLVADVKPGEVVIDVGSGDGRIVMMAAEAFGAKGIGIELDEELVGISRSLVTARGLDGRVEIIHANALDVDLSPADVITLYLELDGLKLLRPHLEHTLRPGTRVVSYVSKIPEWTELPESVEEEEVWLYRVP